MKMNMAKELAALGRMTVTQLREKHVEVFGEATRSGNKDWLRKRIAWRIQATPMATCPSGPGGGPRNWPTMRICGPPPRR